jgi:DNA-binding XRE family transcriptional regulator/molybdate-binding protein
MERATSGLTEARRAAGLTQAELARVAGISRARVSAIESGRHSPSVEAALALARVLHTSVEDLFAGPAPPPEPALGTPVPDGRPVVAAAVGERTVFAPLHSQVAPAEAWPLPDAVMRDGVPMTLPGSTAAGTVAVGCDPALGLAAALLPRSGPQRLVALGGSSASAQAALAAGRAHAAVVHGPEGALPRPRVAVVRVHLARWRVGLATRRGSRRRDVEQLCAAGAAVVQRDGGAASQQALERAAARTGLAVPRGPVAAGHLDAARRVALGAVAGVTMEPAAHACGLEFEGLEEHVVQLWIAEEWTEHPGVRAMLDVLASRAFSRRLELVGGYDVSGCATRVEAA